MARISVMLTKWVFGKNPNSLKLTKGVKSDPIMCVIETVGSHSHITPNM